MLLIHNLEKKYDSTGAEFYHSREFIQLYKIDTIGKLEDCPFPLKTNSFEVLAFGKVNHATPREAKYGHSETFALIKHVKGCGHEEIERINFIEGVEDFTHYGTFFKGADYSIQNWKNRIEYFRSLDCAVCSMAKSYITKFGWGDIFRSRKACLKSFLLVCDYNWLNWREFYSEEKFVEELNKKKAR